VIFATKSDRFCDNISVDFTNIGCILRSPLLPIGPCPNSRNATRDFERVCVDCFPGIVSFTSGHWLGCTATRRSDSLAW